MQSKEFQEFYKNALLRPKPSQLNYTQMRAGFEQMLSSFSPPPDIKIEPTEIHNIKAFWVTAPGVDRDRIILYFHGGGYVVGSTHSHRDFLGRLSRCCNRAVLSVDYRLAPEHPFPAGLEDAFSSYKSVLGKDVVLGGSSAGGGLALSLLLKVKDEQLEMPRSALLISPWVDLAMTGKSIAENENKDILSVKAGAFCRDLYVGKNSLTHPLISPIYGDLSGLPPLFIQTSTFDILYSESLELADKAKSAGVKVTLDIWQDMPHNFSLFAQAFPEAQAAIEKLQDC